MNNHKTDKNFLLYLVGSATSLLGDSLYSTTISIWFVTETGSSMSLLFSVLLLRLPKVFISLIAGPLIDHWNKRKVMFFSDLIQGIVSIISAIFININNMSLSEKIILIYFVNFSYSVFSCFFQPASKAIIPHIINKNKIKEANSFFSGFQNISVLMAFMISAIIVSIFGFYLSIIINGITFFVSALCEWLITYKEDLKYSDNKKSVYNKVIEVKKDLKEAIYFYKKNLNVFALSVSPGLLYLFIYPIINIIFPFIVLRCILPYNMDLIFKIKNFISNEQTTGLAFFRTIYGMSATIGGILTAYAYNKLYVNKNEYKVAFNSMIITGLMLILTAFIYSPIGYTNISSFIILLFICFSAFVIASSCVNNEISVNCWLQINVSKTMQGRFFSFLNLTKELLICTGVLIFGMTSSYFSKPNNLFMYYLISGLFLVILGLVFFYKFIYRVKSLMQQ